ncbi:MAG: YeeE/YedE family protein [Alphaproteobacteria bacterium]|nr:YeeE/YedE family protein [Alphaproteobacteria bacterium]
MSAIASTEGSGYPVQRGVVIAGCALLGLFAYAVALNGWRIATLFGIGALMGLVLYHAAFGFTSAYRRMIVARDVSDVRAQLLMLAIATALFAPALAEGVIFGRSVSGAIAPVGVQVAAGAFMFGLGMQLGGGCGSGTLFTVGGGSIRMLVTLAAFIAGSFWASLHMEWWVSTPRVEGIALGDTLGWSVALVLQLAVFLVLSEILRRWGKRTEVAVDRPTWRRFVTGGWPILWGAVALAILNWVSMIVAGYPWSITWAFTLSGAKIAKFLGWDPTGVWFWTGGFTEKALNSSILTDDTSVMNIGIVLGALIASGLAGRYAPSFRIPLRSLAAAIIGGLLMGYGARIAFGCNIGAFFSGVASTSMHGWLWIAAALIGTWIGVRLRPSFGLSNGS